MTALDFFTNSFKDIEMSFRVSGGAPPPAKAQDDTFCLGATSVFRGMTESITAGVPSGVYTLERRDRDLRLLVEAVEAARVVEEDLPLD